MASQEVGRYVNRAFSGQKDGNTDVSALWPDDDVLTSVRFLRGSVQIVIAGTVVVAVATTNPAKAQLLEPYIPPALGGLGVEPGVTVLSRVRPEYDSLGVRVGNIVIRPQLLENFGYESNVLGTPSPVGGKVVETNASLSAASDWSRNGIRLDLNIDDWRYLDQPTQSFTNLTVSGTGKYEIGRDVITAQYQHMHANQTTRGLDVPTLAQPLGYDVDMLTANYALTLNRVSITPGLSLANYNYEDGTLGGVPYPQAYRDRFVVTPNVIVGYEFAPLRQAVLVVRNSTATYRNQTIPSQRRDYNDTAILSGLEYDVSGLVRFRLLGGYEIRRFTSAIYKTIQAPIVEASVIWIPTGLTTVTGTVSRHVQDTADEATVGYTQTTAILSVDHEYRRNILLRGVGQIDLGEYDQGGSQRLYSATAGITYLLNRQLHLSASYKFTHRQSGGNAILSTTNQSFGGDYSDNLFFIQAQIGF